MALRQGRGTALGRLMFFCALASVLGCAQAVQHQVGGAPGWSLPSLASVNYTVWASAQTFIVGDTLYFNYSKAFHNVMEVTKPNYDGCNATNPIATYDDGATIIALNKTGSFYFLCGVVNHCAVGQKVAVKVLESFALTAPAPSPTHTRASVSSPASADGTSDVSSPPPASSSAASAFRLYVATSFTVALSSLAAFL